MYTIYIYIYIKIYRNIQYSYSLDLNPRWTLEKPWVFQQRRKYFTDQLVSTPVLYTSRGFCMACDTARASTRTRVRLQPGKGQVSTWEGRSTCWPSVLGNPPLGQVYDGNWLWGQRHGSGVCTQPFGRCEKDANGWYYFCYMFLIHWYICHFQTP